MANQQNFRRTQEARPLRVGGKEIAEPVNRARKSRKRLHRNFAQAQRLPTRTGTTEINRAESPADFELDFSGKLFVRVAVARQQNFRQG